MKKTLDDVKKMPKWETKTKAFDEFFFDESETLPQDWQIKVEAWKAYIAIDWVWKEILTK